jgi:hypothetical protein
MVRPFIAATPPPGAPAAGRIMAAISGASMSDGTAMVRMPKSDFDSGLPADTTLSRLDTAWGPDPPVGGLAMEPPVGGLAMDPPVGGLAMECAALGVGGLAWEITAA